MNAMLILKGEGVSPGVAKGTAFIYIDVLKRDTEFYKIDDAQIAGEKVRIEKAIVDVRRNLIIDAKRMEGKLGKESADIFLAQEAMLLDRTIIEDLKKTLEVERINAEHVIRMAFRLLASRFRELNDPVLRERGDDIDDLSRRLLLSLAGIQAHSLEHLPANTVLVASRLLPSDTVFLSRTTTVAVIAEFAGRAAHAALLARELGIPCVGGVPKLLDIVHAGDLLLVDGAKGEVIVKPDAQALQHYEEAGGELQREKDARVRACRAGRAITCDGCAVSVMANVRSREDVELAMELGADGIGLFRTEPFFMAAKHFPSEQEFTRFLLESLSPARGIRIDVRLLDIGADKNPIYLHLPPEPDPFLGRRGVRVLREYPELLETQLSAVLQVSRQFQIGILIPMVTTEDDIVGIAARLRELADNMGIHERPRLGAMIETPAAALSVSMLRQYVDFFSIGTNDLTQYTMAAGRESSTVTEYFIDDHPAILRLIEIVVQEAGDTPVSLCGELAGRANAMSRLLNTGIRSLSVAASLVPDIKNAIRHARVL
ncbi:phosphoenolpyruvate-protein kinase [Candidatus Moduliflexus flocculans]|uniref:Phosphoenolpyruvate-protein phosphotransferase n=1 Tax=Candidatus Moduliflexus flocculans TaxID=1499966 RepID=A0A0S6W094_9BACT|nr:phosphoenolpyruvate-protein kinase [Candidatus Moduliflexus flocculans]